MAIIEYTNHRVPTYIIRVINHGTFGLIRLLSLSKALLKSFAVLHLRLFAVSEKEGTK